MFAAINRNDLSLVAKTGFDHKATANDREFLFSGTIDGVVEDDYTVNTGVSLESIIAQLPKLASRLSGTCQGVSICDDRFEFAVGDLSGITQIYFGAVEENLMLSDDFFEVATAMRTLEYLTDELIYFAKHRYCRAGKTWFRGIHRLPPGTILFVDPNGTASVKACLDDSRGVMVDYQVFKRAFQSTLRSIVDSDPAMENVVVLSGGVDSSLLLAALQPMTDVSALTFRVVPPVRYHEADVVRSRRIARTLNVQRDLVEVDFYDADIGPLLALAACMPFAAQNILFLRAFETLHKGQVRAWSGQNCDTLYSLCATGRRDFLHRFLISEPYLQMQNGVKNHERYYPVKKLTDYLIRRFAKWRLGITAQPPQTFEQLSQFFFNSNVYLALSADADEVATKENKKAQIEDGISAKEAYEALYDEELASFFTGGDSRIVICSGKLNSVQTVLTVLPYSTANMVHLFRSSGQSWMDVLFAKRYVYKYAREFGLSKNSFRVKPSDLGRAYSGTAWENTVINDTAFGSDLASRAKAVEDSLEVHSNGTDLDTFLGLAWVGSTHKLAVQDPLAMHSHGTNLYTLLSLAWVGSTHKLLEQRGVDIEWPQSELIHKNN